mmetsp:Transcript_5897/g.23298  ORF Transcript_5897/g.23298 Transcript_5897/m.23298 type:complete len:216 (+) Transcript_5897:321-968(+)
MCDVQVFIERQKIDVFVFVVAVYDAVIIDVPVERATKRAHARRDERDQHDDGKRQETPDIRVDLRRGALVHSNVVDVMKHVIVALIERRRHAERRHRGVQDEIKRPSRNDGHVKARQVMHGMTVDGERQAILRPLHRIRVEIRAEIDRGVHHGRVRASREAFGAALRLWGEMISRFHRSRTRPGPAQTSAVRLHDVNLPAKRPARALRHALLGVR